MTPWGQKAIEDVARAMAEHHGRVVANAQAGGPWDRLDKNARNYWLDCARAAILACNAALREPSEEMWRNGTAQDKEMCHLWDVWTVMLLQAETEIKP